MANTMPATMSQQVEELTRLVDRAITETRNFTFDLSPPVLYELGLGAALEWLAEQFRKEFALNVIVQCEERAGDTNQEMAVLLFNAGRELLHNAVKHAKATEVRVGCTESGGRLVLTVEDNGVGFNPTERIDVHALDPGFGLFSIRTRLLYVGGEMNIISGPERGTRVELIAPAASSSPQPV
jgi:signal transduction histidine kinase